MYFVRSTCGWDVGACFEQPVSGSGHSRASKQWQFSPKTTLVPIRPSAAFPWRPRIKSPVVVVTTTTTTLSLSTTTKRTSHVSLCEGSSFCSTVSLGRASSALPLFIGFFFFCLSVSSISVFVSLAWSGRDSLATPPPARGPSTEPEPISLPPPTTATGSCCAACE